MIVVDSNVVAYYWANGPLASIAQRVRDKDAGWHMPAPWRSEMRSILAGVEAVRAIKGLESQRRASLKI